eukprot:1452720-Rhodomonas_salina.1
MACDGSPRLSCLCAGLTDNVADNVTGNVGADRGLVSAGVAQERRLRDPAEGPKQRRAPAA